jgi:predicted signal transduction protein with EAL and GGDEF domain
MSTNYVHSLKYMPKFIKFMYCNYCVMYPIMFYTLLCSGVAICISRPKVKGKWLAIFILV